MRVEIINGVADFVVLDGPNIRVSHTNYFFFFPKKRNKGHLSIALCPDLLGAMPSGHLGQAIDDATKKNNIVPRFYKWGFVKKCLVGGW